MCRKRMDGRCVWERRLGLGSAEHLISIDEEEV